MEQQLRQALQCGQMERALELIRDYREDFDQVWSGLSENERRASSLPGQALRLMRWAQSMALSLRAEQETRRASLRSARSYERAVDRRLQTWEVMA